MIIIKILAPKKRLSNTSYWKRGGVVWEGRDNGLVRGGGRTFNEYYAMNNSGSMNAHYSDKQGANIVCNSQNAHHKVM